MSKTADEWKSEGNAFVQSGEFQKGVDCYSSAIEVASEQKKPLHVYFSNRSAAYSHLGQYKEAVEDADSCINSAAESGVNFVKGYSRKGAALFKLGKHKDAEAAYKEGLEKDANNAALLNGLSELKPYLDTPAGNFKPMDTPFGNTLDIMGKLASNPETASLMEDSEFMNVMMQAQSNPMLLLQHMGNPKFAKAFEVITGLNMSNINQKAKGMSNKFGDMASGPRNDDPASNDASFPKRSKNTEPMDEQMQDDTSDGEDDADKVERERKDQAEASKQKGTECYKKRDFEGALEHYGNASNLDARNPVFLSNTAAVYLEMKEYEKCREICEKAIALAREERADFKLVARILARIGASYEKEGIHEKAMEWYNRSLSEFRDPKILDKVKKTQRQAAETKRKAYLSQDKFHENKEQAKGFISSGDYPSAMRCYQECFKRIDATDPANNVDLAIIHSNMAFCHHKRGEWGPSCAEAERALEKDPTFIKAYLRKGSAMEAWGTTNPTKFYDAMKAFKSARALDPSNNDANTGFANCMYKWRDICRKDQEKVKYVAEHDPEIRNIMKDPAMRQILEEMQSNRNAVKEHLSNPMIKAKIELLTEAGIISVGY